MYVSVITLIIEYFKMIIKDNSASGNNTEAYMYDKMNSQAYFKSCNMLLCKLHVS